MRRVRDQAGGLHGSHRCAGSCAERNDRRVNRGTTARRGAALAGIVCSAGARGSRAWYPLRVARPTGRPSQVQR